MRSRDEKPGVMSALAGRLPVAAFAFVAACSTAPPRSGETPDRPQQPPEPAAHEQSAAPEPAAPSERSRGDYPEVERSEAGFTITEQVPISGEVREDYQGALQLLRQERLEQGIELLVAVTEKAPDVTAPYIDLGIAYGRSGDLERAEQALETAAQLSPEHPIAHNELGIIYRKTGRFDAARTSYERALETYPGFHFARRNLAVLCDLYLLDLSCALQNYEAYMESVTEDEQVEIWIADVRNRLGQ